MTDEKVIRGDFGRHPFRHLEEMHGELRAVISQWEGRAALAEVLGVLDIVRHELLQENADD